MDTDRIKGLGRELYGRGEEAVGALMGDKETRARGLMDQAAGKAQSTISRAGEALRETVAETLEPGRDPSPRHEGPMRGAGVMRTPPLGALLIAASAGFALAWMLQARTR